MAIYGAATSRAVGRCEVPGAALGRSQVVRQRILIPPFGGSNPPAPARAIPGVDRTRQSASGENPRRRLYAGL